LISLVSSSASAEDFPYGESDVRRRDFLNIASVSFAGVGGVIALAPLVAQMAPSADVFAQARTEIDTSRVAPGQRI